MWLYKGFKTEKEAKESRKEKGGYIVHELNSHRTGKPIGCGQEYEFCLAQSGCDRNVVKFFHIYRI